MLIPVAVFTAAFHDRLSRPYRSRRVSSVIETTIPADTVYSSSDSSFFVPIPATVMVFKKKGKRGRLLDILMVVVVFSSGYVVWRYHMVEKSPSVHPTRQRKVLMPAPPDRRRSPEILVPNGWIGLEVERAPLTRSGRKSTRARRDVLMDAKSGSVCQLAVSCT